jgi:hypothetical protein
MQWDCIYIVLVDGGEYEIGRSARIYCKMFAGKGELPKTTLKITNMDRKNGILLVIRTLIHLLTLMRKTRGPWATSLT